jgi:hypothetical protein
MDRISIHGLNVAMDATVKQKPRAIQCSARLDVEHWIIFSKSYAEQAPTRVNMDYIAMLGQLDVWRDLRRSFGAGNCGHVKGPASKALTNEIQSLKTN